MKTSLRAFSLEKKRSNLFLSVSARMFTAGSLIEFKNSKFLINNASKNRRDREVSARYTGLS